VAKCVQKEDAPFLGLVAFVFSVHQVIALCLGRVKRFPEPPLVLERPASGRDENGLDSLTHTE